MHPTKMGCCVKKQGCHVVHVVVILVVVDVIVVILIIVIIIVEITPHSARNLSEQGWLLRYKTVH